MLAREVVPPPRHIYPRDPWRIIESRYDPTHFARAETVFSLGNGYVGVRGTYDEPHPVVAPGTFVNGFHETWPIVHAEHAYGLARTGQTIVTVPDAMAIQLSVDDEPLFLPFARTRRYERVLDMRAGTLSRDLVWSTAAGKHVRVRSCRLVSLEHRHLLAVTYEVTVLDHPSPVAISLQVVNHQDMRRRNGEPGLESLDPRLGRSFSHRVLHEQLRDGSHEGRLVLGYETGNSHMTLGVAVEDVIETECDYERSVTTREDCDEVCIATDGQPGVPIRITRYVAYHHSRSAPVSDLAARCRRTLDRAHRGGFEQLLETQRDHLDRFWDRADVEVESDPAVDVVGVQQAVRWNLFQLAQAAWRAEGTGIPAKGLTSQAYEGHYFWDTEVYVLPFLAYTQPRVARNLLRFRHGMLDAARARAATLDLRGALFPWRTINGEEASAYYQAGTAQYHIDADVAYAVQKYVDVRGDVGFLVEAGAEVLIETARMWEDLGFYCPEGHFHIHGVTGPDEYTTVVNDNTYTNLMARLNLRNAVAAVRRLQEERPDDYTSVVHSCRLVPGEVDRWERAAAAMYVPYDDGRGMHPQDDAFLDREVWELKATPPDRFPLLLHYHPLVIYRYQVLKQADVVLAMFLLGDEFAEEQKRANFEYYDPITTGDSSLSAAIESIVAAEVGHEDKAAEYFRYAMLMDLADLEGNVSDGVHVASAGGVWMALVFGFGGVRDFQGHLSFEPRLPSTWSSLRFSLRFQDRQLRIAITHDEERYLVESGAPLEVTVRGKPVLLMPGVPAVVTPG